MRLPFFAGPSNQTRSSVVDPEDCVNWFLEAQVPSAKVSPVLYPTPGLTSFCTRAFNPNNGQTWTIAEPNRGLLALETTANGALSYDGLFVAGPHVYQLRDIAGSQSAGLTALIVSATAGGVKPMAQNAFPASMAYNGSVGVEMIVASGGEVYLASQAGGTWAWWPANPVLTGHSIIHVGFADSFFLALDSTSTLRISESFDGTTWDPTQAVQRTNQPDPWIAMIVIHDQIWLFGTRTTDVWWNAGTSPFPFRALDGVTIQHGAAAAFSVAELDNAPIWLGRGTAGQGMVFRADGYTPQRVSSFALEAAIEQYATISDAEGMSFLIGGHWFYVLTFPTANASWMYDASQQTWTRVGYWNRALMRYDAYRPRTHALFGQTHLVGDRMTGGIYSVSEQVSTDVDGLGIRRLRRTPIASDQGLRLFHQRLQVDLEAGLGLTTGQGSDPQVMLRYSDDSGKTWSNERWVSAGALGKYRARAQWNRLGSSRNRVYEVVTSDPVPYRLLDAYLTVAEGVF